MGLLGWFSKKKSEEQSTKQEEKRPVIQRPWSPTTEMKRGYAVMMLTDRFLVDEWPISEENDQLLEKDFESKLLDMRIFNESMEFRIFRSDIGKDFHYCTLADEPHSQYFDEAQYLDIDDKYSKENGMVQTTGGGKYNLPLQKYRNAKVVIRNYIEYDKDNGQAYIKNWRLLKFEEE